MSTSNTYYKHKWSIKVLVFFYSLIPRSILNKLLVLHRNTNGILGYGIRYAILKNLAKKCGDNVAVDVGVFLINPEEMSLGSNVSINPMSYLTGTGGLSIGDNVSIAHRVTIMTATHNYNDISVPIKHQGLTYKPVVIEDNVWIGANVVIVAGCTVRTGAVVGANSVVTKDVQSNEVWAGAPAKYIKRR